MLEVGTGSIQRTWDWIGFESFEVIDLEVNGHIQPSNKNFPCGTPGLPYKASYHAPMMAGSSISVNYTVPNLFGENRWTFGHEHGQK